VSYLLSRLAACGVPREDAVRLGLFVGGFTGIYHLLRGYLQRWRPDKSGANCVAAGAAAGARWICGWLNEDGCAELPGRRLCLPA
jgi:hypothetical protein